MATDFAHPPEDSMLLPAVADEVCFARDPVIKGWYNHPLGTLLSRQFQERD